MPEKNIKLTAPASVGMIIHQSKLILAKKIVWPIIFMLADFFFAYPLLVKGALTTALFLTILTLSFFWITSKTYIWFNKKLIISNLTIIDVDQINIFKKIVTVVKMAEVNEVAVHRAGFWQRVFRLGNLYLIYNEGKTRIDFFNITKPKSVQKYLATFIHNDLTPAPDQKIDDRKIIEYLKEVKKSVGERKFQEIISKVGESDRDELIED
ncbi:MAG: hypothetical protein PHW95_01590 [Patescibacteria group bacterium]|nr:hypothetical protein [Patescibacteria group bacterium]